MAETKFLTLVSLLFSGQEEMELNQEPCQKGEW